jgi:hypothetical protein
VQKLGPLPPPAQIIKLSGQMRGSGGFISWRGRLRGGAERALDGVWVRSNFKASYLDKVIAAGGSFVHIPTGNAQERPCCTSGHRDGPKVLSAQTSPEKSAAECPVVAYPQGGADFCAAYGLASALHAYGDAAAAASVARLARAALASRDAFGYVRKVVREEAAGWGEVPLAQHDPLHVHIPEPVHMQLVGSDGGGAHAVATLGGMIFDAAEARALPLTRASLDRCVGMHLNGATFSHVARAVKLVPGKSVRRMLARCARE